MQFVSKQFDKEYYLLNPVIFIPGWGFKGSIIDLLDSAGNWLYPDSFIDPFTFEEDLHTFIEQHSISKVILVGWSMGGYLALDFAEKYPQRIGALHLLSLRKNWPANEVNELREKLIQHPRTTMKEFYRRCFLGHKTQFKVFVDKMQDTFLREAPLDVLLHGLDYLETVKVGKLPEVETFIHHGNKDLVAPFDQAVEVDGRPRIVYPNTGHGVFLSPEFDLILGEKKRTLQKKFSAAAASYDEHAVVQKNIVAQMGKQLPDVQGPNSILEIGCGTGNFTAKLVKRYPHRKIVAIDFSSGMITQAKQKHANNTNITFLCLDAEKYLERTTEPYDLITSNATLQWFDNLPGAFIHIDQLLAQGGRMLVSIFGSKSMCQLKEALQELFGYEDLPVHSFPNSDILAKNLKRFTNVQIAEVNIDMQYGSFKELLASMKKTGTGGWHAVQPPVLTRNRLAKLDKWFAEKYNGYKITYQVFLISAEKQGATF